MLGERLEQRPRLQSLPGDPGRAPDRAIFAACGKDGLEPAGCVVVGVHVIRERETFVTFFWNDVNLQISTLFPPKRSCRSLELPRMPLAFYRALRHPVDVPDLFRTGRASGNRRGLCWPCPEKT